MNPRWYRCKIKQTWNRYGLGSVLGGVMYAKKRMDPPFDNMVSLYNGNAYNLPETAQREFCRIHLERERLATEEEVKELLGQLNKALSF